MKFELDGKEYTEEDMSEDTVKDVVALGELHEKITKVCAELHYLYAAENTLLSRVRKELGGD